MNKTANSVATRAQNLFRRLTKLFRGDAPIRVGPKATASFQERTLQHGERTFRYFYRAARDRDAPLLIVFHSRGRSRQPPIFADDRFHLLFPIDDHGFRDAGSWFLGCDGEFFWLDALLAMVREVHDGDEIYTMGADTGGYGAIVHGINLSARAVYAHSPRTRPIGTALAHQGLRHEIHAVFGRTVTTPYADLRKLLKPGLETRFVLTARSRERAQYHAEQFLPFVEALTASDIECEAHVAETAGGGSPTAFAQAADRLHAMRQGRAFAPWPAQVGAASEAVASPQERAREVLATTILRPAEVWSEPYPHMVGRFEEKLDAYAKRAGIEPDGETILAHLLDQADRRAFARPRTFFVASPGGSGSHWLQQILSHNAGTVSCGEVYLPEAMMQVLLDAGSKARGRLIDAMHLLHAYEIRDDMRDTMLINTAHARGWRIAAHMPDPTTTILLQRDPYDVVMSRAFRKPGMKRKQFADKSAQDYFQQQIDYVHRFYEARDVSRVDVIVKYEDLKTDIAGTLRALAKSDHMPIDVSRIEDTAAAFARGELDANKYRGPRIEIDERYRSSAREQLAELRTHLGYGD